jgi:hypothetical protein
MRNTAIATALVLAAALGCGQKDPLEGADGGAEAADYFPLRDGARYDYLHSNGQWTETVTFEALPLPGRSEEQTLERQGDQVVRVAQQIFAGGQLSMSVVYDPGFVRFSYAWPDAEAGFMQRQTYQRTETPAGGAARPARERAHVFRVETLSETVTTPAGTFRGCLQIWRMRDYEVMTSAGVVAEDQEKLYWFCPDVGKVREQDSTDGTFEVLTAFDLPEP